MARKVESVGGPFVQEEGLLGVFTREQGTDAILNGAVVQKVNSEQGDSAKDGTKAIVVGSLRLDIYPGLLEEIGPPGAPPMDDVKVVYFVRWETHRNMVMAVADNRVLEMKDEPLPFDPDAPDPTSVNPAQSSDAAPFTLLPPEPHLCQVCASQHAPEEPHNPASLYWQSARQMQGEEPATWEDGLAHCPPSVRDSWINVLRTKDVEIDMAKLERLATQQEAK